jgi:hypothetical protein
MEPHARHHRPSFDPRIDDPTVRAAQGERLLSFVRDLEAEHGPIDPVKRAEVRAKLEATDAQALPPTHEPASRTARLHARQRRAVTLRQQPT